MKNKILMTKVLLALAVCADSTLDLVVLFNTCHFDGDFGKEKTKG